MPFFLYGDISRYKRENGLRRATFPSSWKSSQKSRKKPMASSLPCALRRVKNCNHLPHVHVKFPFSSGQKNRLCSCAAAADRHGEGHYASIVRAVEDAGPYTPFIIPSPPTFSVLSNTRTPFHSPHASSIAALRNDRNVAANTFPARTGCNAGGNRCNSYRSFPPYNLLGHRSVSI